MSTAARPCTDPRCCRYAALDGAVIDAYGWQSDISDDEILERLLAENLRRSAASESANLT